MVKRLVLICISILWLMPAAALPEADTGAALYPIRENGLWGYMDRQGNVVIDPQWARAESFRGQYAVVYPETDACGAVEDDQCGIIDASGNWVLLPAQWDIQSTDNYGAYIGGRDEGIYIIWERSEQRKKGFFDIPHGFFSGLRYDWVDGEWVGQVDPELVCVELDGKKGFAGRRTGEILIPCRYDPLQYYCFEGDYCAVLYGERSSDQWILMDRKGTEIRLPEDCFLAAVPLKSSDVEQGLVPVRRAEDASGFKEGEALCGYIDLEGNMVIEPQYTYAYSFSEGLACVILSDGGSAVITPDNEIAAVLQDPVGRFGSDPGYVQGLLKLAHYSESGELEYVYFLDHRCTEAFRLEIEDMYNTSAPYENGTAFYFVGKRSPSGGYTDLGAGLFNMDGEILTPPVFDPDEADLYFLNGFEEGLLPICDMASGKYGFIDDRGRWVIAPEWDRASDFRDGLALVEKDGRLMYIDRGGAVVWEENSRGRSVIVRGVRTGSHHSFHTALWDRII